MLPSHGKEGLTIKMIKNIRMMHRISIVAVTPSFIRDSIELTVVLTVTMFQVATHVIRIFACAALELYVHLLIDNLFVCVEKESLETDKNSLFQPKQSSMIHLLLFTQSLMIAFHNGLILYQSRPYYLILVASSVFLQHLALTFGVCPVAWRCDRKVVYNP